MTTSLAWIGELRKKAKPGMSINMARSILTLLQKEVDDKNQLPPHAYKVVAKALNISEMRCRFLFTECRKALKQYSSLEAYWEAGREYQYKWKPKVKAGK